MKVMKSITITKFVVKVTRKGTLATQYVQRTDKSPIQMTTNRKLALIMGKFDGARHCRIPPAHTLQFRVGICTSACLRPNFPIRAPIAAQSTATSVTKPKALVGIVLSLVPIYRQLCKTLK